MHIVEAMKKTEMAMKEYLDLGFTAFEVGESNIVIRNSYVSSMVKEHGNNYQWVLDAKNNPNFFYALEDESMKYIKEWGNLVIKDKNYNSFDCSEHCFGSNPRPDIKTDYSKMRVSKNIFGVLDSGRTDLLVRYNNKIGCLIDINGNFVNLAIWIDDIHTKRYGDGRIIVEKLRKHPHVRWAKSIPTFHMNIDSWGMYTVHAVINLPVDIYQEYKKIGDFWNRKKWLVETHLGIPVFNHDAH